VKAFADLYRALDAATSTRHKIEALTAYLKPALADAARWAEAAWVVYLLAGGKRKQMIPTRLLRRLALEATGLPEWLVEESYQNVGDLAETLALLLPPPAKEENVPLEAWMDERLPALRALDDEARYALLLAYVAAMAEADRLVFFKLTTGALRVGVARGQVVQALSEATGLDAPTVAERLMGYTQADRSVTSADFGALATPAAASPAAGGRPYPFFLSHQLVAPVEELPEKLGPTEGWIAEWKFDGIRAQLLARGGEWRLWSRGEELIAEAFPDLRPVAATLPAGTALDGEIVIARAGTGVQAIEPFASLQQRLNRKVVTEKLTAELPVAFIAYDLLEEGGVDLRGSPLFERRARLERIVEDARGNGATALRLSPRVEAPDWAGLAALRESARAIGAEGLMLKGSEAPYGVGRKRSGPGERDLWWKWKLDPMAVDAVLIYAQRGHGRRASVYSDYTFAVWSGPQDEAGRALVPFAKAYSGLTDAEMREVDAIIRRTTTESFGPVRGVAPTMVFELGFEGIALSKRHKSGVATRFPRMLRWRRDKPVEEADTLAELRALLPVSRPSA
jgi:DNA ligase-1